MLKYLKVVFFAGMVVFAMAANAQVDPNRVVAIVNGEEIKGAEYYHLMEYMPGVGRVFNDKFAEAPPGLMALQKLIEERLLLQMAKQQNVLPTAAEIESEKQNRLKDNPNLMTQLSAAGLVASDFDHQILMDLTQFKIQTKGIIITDQEVENFFKTNPTMFTLPKAYKLKMIVADTEADRSAIDADIKAGKDFGEVAKTRSTGATKLNGGDIGMIAVDTMDKTLKDALNATSVGKTTDWLGKDSTKFKFLLVDVLPEKLQTFDDKLKLSIRRQMMIDRGRVKNDVAKMMKDMWKTAKLDLKQKEFEPAIRQIADGLKIGG